MGRRFCFGYSIIISAYMHPSQTTIYKCNRDTGDGICDCGDVVGEFEVACVLCLWRRRLRCGGLCDWD